MLDRDEQWFFLWTEGLTPDIRHDGSGGLKNFLFYHRNFLNLSIHMRRSIEFYEPENVIVGLVPDGLFSTFGKTGRSVSMRRINIICIEKSLLSGDQVKWIEHEIGHIISWRDYRDKPKVNSPFITGGESNPFRPEDVSGHNLYPNDWSEYIPFTRQMKALLNENPTEKIIRMIMEDYEERQNSKEDLKKYEQTFINYMKCVLGKDIRHYREQ